MSNEPDPKAAQTIGKMPDGPENLRAIREAKGISLRDIFEQTRVSTVNLEAIESGDFSRLPAPVSARTFIKTYAKMVGVDSTPILSRYAKYLETRNAPKVAAETGGLDGGQGRKMEMEGEKEEPAPPPVAAPEKKRWLLVLIFLVAAAAIAAAFLFLSMPPPKPAPETAAPPAPPQAAQPEISIPVPPAVQDKAVQPPPAIDPPLPEKAREPQTKRESSPAAPVEPAARPERTLSGPAEVSVAADTGKHRLVIEAREVTWLRIKADQNPSRQVLLQPGEKIERFAEEQFQLDIGNAAGVDVSFGGKALGRLGGPAEVVHLTLP